MPSSYILVAVKVPLDIDMALDEATSVVKTLYRDGFRQVTVLNTIPAPE